MKWRVPEANKTDEQPKKKQRLEESKEIKKEERLKEERKIDTKTTTTKQQKRTNETKSNTLSTFTASVLLNMPCLKNESIFTNK